MNWATFGGSLAAVLALGGIAAWLKLGGPDRIFVTEEDAMRAAEDAIAGFAARGAVVGSDGRAALAVGEDGRVVVLKAHGARHAVRETRWDSVRADPAGLIVMTGERRFGAVTIADADPLEARRLASSLTSV